MAFKKGQSGNPSGRPKVLTADGRSLSEIAKAHTEAAIDTLVDVMGNGDTSSARVSAATALLDRAWGRPKQDIGLDVTEDLAALIDQRRQQVTNAR